MWKLVVEIGILSYFIGMSYISNFLRIWGLMIQKYILVISEKDSIKLKSRVSSVWNGSRSGTEFEIPIIVDIKNYSTVFVKQLKSCNCNDSNNDNVTGRIGWKGPGLLLLLLLLLSLFLSSCSSIDCIHVLYIVFFLFVPIMRQNILFSIWIIFFII